jgi:predicted ribosomally synthesized peptide with nif11-like leader
MELIMSIERVIAFGKLTMTDDKLRSELENAVKGKSPDEAANAAAAIANRHGFQCTPAEVKEGYQAYMSGNITDAGGQLSDTQLEAVAGGPGPGGGKGPSISDEWNKQFSGGGGKGGGHK